MMEDTVLTAKKVNLGKRKGHMGKGNGGNNAKSGGGGRGGGGGKGKFSKKR